MTLKIAELMRQPTADHNLCWLQKALQAAIGTRNPSSLPLWTMGAEGSKFRSGKPDKKITFEEMGHLGLACNLLRATGKQPKIFDGYDEIKYPGPLPGGVCENVHAD
ncbi:MAG TPA: ferritin-like domain-containing protein [Pyrinomonadaceae bacterium]|nr:ferritin-like domain-containing protein [Pyrinomonadaceae bacterium]